MKKKIHFDSRWCGEHGIGRYAKEIEKRNPQFNRITSKIKPSSPLDVFYITAYLALHHGVYFSPGYNAPFIFLKRCVISVHDLNHVDIEHNSSFLKRLYYNLILKRACRHSLKIFTVSEFSKKRICEWANVSPSKIKVVGNGVSAEFNKDVVPFPGSYIIVVGNRKKHKNELRAIEAFSRASLSESIKLVFTGECSDELKEKINSLNLGDKVIFVGKVSNDELASLYKGALMLLFPSLYEGFGLPVIEAMACGTPVITSNVTSLPEISGNAALLVDPYSIDAITKAIELISNDVEVRNQLITDGYTQAKKYSWEQTVEKIDKEIKELIAHSD
ncbi:glycosyltransferase family 4 protein [Klebsiella quasipneumoniae]|uniref:glycosyltransferase family 4 protein n=1 Tax=Klebsiella quasipneumoniae TaxID=1463165 RepID=UPI001C268A75|nr:glycosyltransferase family 1 protein [Klebsiella quasipneumoniae]MBU8944447.1 glycosyltransferase family 4 protein [Klebsiella quasipneumoniae]